MHGIQTVKNRSTTKCGKFSLCTIFTISQVFGASLIFRHGSKSSNIFRFQLVLHYAWTICYYMALTYAIFQVFYESETDKPKLEKILSILCHVTRFISNLTILITCICIFHTNQLEQVFNSMRLIDARISVISVAGTENKSDPNSRFNVCIIITFVLLNAVILLLEFIDTNESMMEFLNDIAAYILPNCSLTLMHLQFVNFLRNLKERYGKVNAMLTKLMEKPQQCENFGQKEIGLSHHRLEVAINELRLIHFHLGVLHVRLTKLYGPVLCTMFLSISMALLILLFEFFEFNQSSFSLSYRVAWITLYGSTMLVLLVACERLSEKV